MNTCVACVVLDRQNQYTVGGQPGCDRDEKTVYCNGKLKLYSEYCVKLRGYTAEHYVDSPCAYVITNSSKSSSLTHSIT